MTSCTASAHGADQSFADWDMARIGRALHDAITTTMAGWLAMAGPRGPIGNAMGGGPQPPHGAGAPLRGPRGGGFPFGPDFPFGRRGRGQGRAGRGDVRLAILALLAEGPRHGYQLIQEIAARSQGAWSPSPGSVYPALSALQDEGLIDDEKVDGRRVFSLTAAGREQVAARRDELAAVFAANAPGPEHEEAVDVRKLMLGVGGAAMTVMQCGTSDQRQAARMILDQARKDLYRILAEDSPADLQPRVAAEGANADGSSPDGTGSEGTGWDGTIADGGGLTGA